MARLSFAGLVGLTLGALGSGLASECDPSKLSPPALAARLQELAKRAERAFERRELAPAARDLREAICLSAENARLHYALGVVENAAGNWTPAREALERADKLEPDNPLPLAMMVKVSLAGREIERVKKLLRAAADRFPRNGKLHAELVGELLQHQQDDLALAEALRYEQSGDPNPEATLMLATLENVAGAHRDAIRHALTLAGQSLLPDRIRASAAGIAGLSYEGLGRLEDATHHLKLAIRLAPSLHEDPYLSLARILQGTASYKEAVKVLEQGRRELPDSAKLMRALGSNLVLAGEYQHGLHVLAELVQRFPDRHDAYVELADAYRKSGEGRLATETLQKLGRRQPDYPMIHVMIAQSMLPAGAADYPAVLEELAKAEVVSPSDPDIYYLRGKVYAAMDRYSEAAAALRRAVELRPTDPSAYYQLGLAYQKLGQPALAREQFERMQHLKGQPATP